MTFLFGRTFFLFGRVPWFCGRFYYIYRHETHCPLIASSHILRVLLIDDEADACDTLRLLLAKHRDVEIAGQANTLPDAAEAIGKLSPNLVFLDVQMGTQNGFDLLEDFLNPDFQLIFCTGYNQYALQAIKKNALDYLLKPVDPDELDRAIEKARKNLPQPVSRLMLSCSGEWWAVEPREIEYIESDGSYTTLKLLDGRHCVLVKSLRQFEEMLPPTDFMRIHQSFLVNLNGVRKYLKSETGLEMRSGARLPVARRRKAALEEALLGKT